MLNDLMEIGVTSGHIPAVTTVHYGGRAWGMLVEQTALSSGMLVLSGSTAPWVMDATKKLEALGKFPPGWDS